ncbi:hypothetical protein FG064_18845 [Vibrio cholerae]|nr:hypothetical protein [Vibrio cholerae]EGR0469028.1 hypothetical protein [Vibrio cholerae]ELF5327089.1 hypothetical protein [Vibrio cholerae]HDI3138871.1 hypothetical protein [Vibrio cholerae]
MTVKLNRSDLQTEKYSYVWERDNGDGKYRGSLDRKKVDKDEGYEVLYLIQSFINDNSLEYSQELVHKLEDTVHSKSEIVDRSLLQFLLARSLGLK